MWLWQGRSIARPPLMLLDEPLNNLDANLREEMRFEIKELQKKFGFSILYVTHDQSEAMALSDRIMIMQSGLVERVDTPLNIYNHPINKFVFSFIGLSNFLNVEKDGETMRVVGDGEPLAIDNVPGGLFDRAPQAVLASRPEEIEFTDNRHLRGLVKAGPISARSSITLSQWEIRSCACRKAPARLAPWPVKPAACGCCAPTGILRKEDDPGCFHVDTILSGVVRSTKSHGAGMCVPRHASRKVLLQKKSRTCVRPEV